VVQENVTIRFRADGTRVVERDIKRMGAASKGASSSVAFLRQSLGALGGALLLREAVRTLADFSQEMSTVRAITQATSSQFVELEAKARDLGATTRFSATQAAEGMSFLARAGFDVDEVLAATADTLVLAQAGALDLGRAADIASNVLTGFRLEAAEAGRVVDVLAAAANSGNTTVEQLGQGMKLVAPIASGLGVSLEESTAAMTALSDAGLQASLAGTGLRRVLSELESPSSKNIKTLRLLGLSTDDVRVSQVGLTSALEKLVEAGVDTGFALEFFGDRGGPAFEVLSTSIPKVKQLTDELNKNAGTARRVASIMDDNLKGALFAVKSAFEAVILSVGDLGTESFLTSALRKLADALRFVAGNAELLSIAMGVIATLTLPLLISGLTAVTVLLLANPFAVVAATLGGLIALVAKFGKQMKATEDGIASMRDVLDSTLAVIKEVFGQAVTIVRNFANIAAAGFRQVENSGNNSFKSVATSIAILLDTTAGVVLGLAEGLVTFLQQVPKTLLSVVGDAIVATVDNVLRSVSFLLNQILEKTEATLTQLNSFIGKGAVDLGRVSFQETPLSFFGDKPTVEKELTNLADVALAAFYGRVAETTGARSVVEQIFNDAEIRAKSRQLIEIPGQLADRFKEAGEGLSGVFDALTKSVGQSVSLVERLAGKKTVDAFAGAIKGIGAKEIGGDPAEENRLLEEKRNIVGDIRLIEEDAVKRRADINKQLELGNLEEEEHRLLLADVDAAARKSSDSLGAVADQFKTIDNSARALGQAVGQSLVQGIGNASSALSDFLVEGANDIEGLREAIAGILKDIAKQILATIIQALILKAITIGIGAAGGGGDAGAAGTFIPAGGKRQAGGPADGRPVLVGERGPELFVPTQSGRVIPNSQMEAAPPQVNVSVVNVSDPDEVRNALNTPEGEATVMNIVRKNKRALNATT